jgi:chemotaxis response regulator CheB
MGSDGGDGLQALHQAQGLTVVQNQESSIAYDMPQEAVLRNAADYVLAPAEIAALLRTLRPSGVASEIETKGTADA